MLYPRGVLVWLALAVQIQAAACATAPSPSPQHGHPPLSLGSEEVHRIGVPAQPLRMGGGGQETAAFQVTQLVQGRDLTDVELVQRSASSNSVPATMMPRSGSASSQPAAMMSPLQKTVHDEAQERVTEGLRQTATASSPNLKLKLRVCGAWVAEKVNAVLNALGQKPVFKVDAVEKLLRTMVLRMRDNASALVRACRQLQLLAASPASLRASPASLRAAVDHILTAMRVHDGHAELQAVALETLAVLASHDVSSGCVDMGEAIVEAGGIALAIQAMREHHGDPLVQAAASRALHLLQLGQGGKYSTRIIDQGGIACLAAVVAADNLALPASSAVGHRSAGAMAKEILWSLAGDTLNDITRGSSAALAADIRGLVWAMKAFPDSHQVQHFVLWVLSTLAVDGDCRQRIGAHEGMRGMIDAMQRYEADAELQHFACFGLAVLAQDHHNLATLREEGGIARILASFAAHLGDGKVTAAACAALKVLALDTGCRLQIVSLGGVEVLLQAMDDHAQDAAVQQAAGNALVNLAGDNETSVRLVCAGCIERMKAAMHAHGDTIEVQLMACRGMSQLEARAGKDTDALQRIAAMSGIDLILRALELSHRDTMLGLSCCGVYTRAGTHTHTHTQKHTHTHTHHGRLGRN